MMISILIGVIVWIIGFFLGKSVKNKCRDNDINELINTIELLKYSEVDYFTALDNDVYAVKKSSGLILLMKIPEDPNYPDYASDTALEIADYLNSELC